MDTQRWKTELAETLATVEAQLADDPGNFKALWAASFFGSLTPTPSEPIRAAGARFDAESSRLSDEELAERFRELGIADLLEVLWVGLNENSYGWQAIPAIAECFGGIVEDADRLCAMAWRPINNGYTEGEILRTCDRLFKRALQLDPQNPEARYFYSHAGFREDLLEEGIELPPPDDRDGAPRVRELVARFERGEHPLNLSCEMETIEVDTTEVVEALIEGLSAHEWRCRAQCAKALGRARVDRPLVIEALDQLMDEETQQRVTEKALIAMEEVLRSCAESAPGG